MTRLQKTFICIFVFIYVLALLAAGLVLLAIPTPYSETYLGELPVKIERLKTTEGKRVILVGGSAVPFGVDSSMIAGAFSDEEKVPELPGRLKGYEVVDFGLYGSIGSKVMLEILEPYIHKGDIIIVLPEMQKDSMSGFFEGKYLWQALGAGALRYVFRLDTDERNMLLNRLPVFLLDKISMLGGGKDTGDPGIYAKDSFNEYGDIGAFRADNTMTGGFDPDNLITFDEKYLVEDLISFTGSFGRKCHEKGAKLYLGYAPMNAAAVTSPVDEIDKYESGLRSNPDISLIGCANEAIMDESFFYDTNYHLNSEGCKEYTVRLIKWIRAEYGDPTYTPPVEIEETTETDDAGGQSKTLEGSGEGLRYEEGEDSIRITGIEESMAEAREVTIPVSINGKKVTSIADGSFAGYSNLKRIIIESSEPASVRVGRYLLDGCDASVVVPKGASSAYKTNYFWSQYSERISEEE